MPSQLGLPRCWSGWRVQLPSRVHVSRAAIFLVLAFTCCRGEALDVAWAGDPVPRSGERIELRPATHRWVLRAHAPEHYRVEVGWPSTQGRPLLGLSGNKTAEDELDELSPDGQPKLGPPGGEVSGELEVDPADKFVVIRAVAFGIGVEPMWVRITRVGPKIKLDPSKFQTP